MPADRVSETGLYLAVGAPDGVLPELLLVLSADPLDVGAALVGLLSGVEQYDLVAGLADDGAVVSAPLSVRVPEGEPVGEGGGDLVVQEPGELPLVTGSRPSGRCAAKCSRVSR